MTQRGAAFRHCRHGYVYINCSIPPLIWRNYTYKHTRTHSQALGSNDRQTKQRDVDARSRLSEPGGASCSPRKCYENRLPFTGILVGAAALVTTTAPFGWDMFGFTKHTTGKRLQLTTHTHTHARA